MSEKGKLTCDMAQDMIPLYIDDVLSEDSKKALEEHLGGCEKCRQSLKEMGADIQGLSKEDQDIRLFQRVQKGFRKAYFLKAFLVILCVLAVWAGANFYVMGHYSPVNPKADAEYIKECLEVVKIDGKYYLHQTDFFARGEILVLSLTEENIENGVVNIYLGENGLRSLGLGRSYVTNELYQMIPGTEDMEEVRVINYCKPDETVITTLWQAGEECKELAE